MTIAQVRDLAERGLSQRAAARELGVGRAVVRLIAKSHDIRFGAAKRYRRRSLEEAQAWLRNRLAESS